MEKRTKEEGMTMRLLFIECWEIVWKILENSTRPVVDITPSFNTEGDQSEASGRQNGAIFEPNFWNRDFYPKSSNCSWGRIQNTSQCPLILPAPTSKAVTSNTGEWKLDNWERERERERERLKRWMSKDKESKEKEGRDRNRNDLR